MVKNSTPFPSKEEMHSRSHPSLFKPLLSRCVSEQTDQTTKLLSLAIQETANSSDHRPHRWSLRMLHSLLVFAKLLD